MSLTYMKNDALSI